MYDVESCMSNHSADFLFKVVYLKTSFKTVVHEFVDMRNAKNGVRMRKFWYAEIRVTILGNAYK